MLKPALAAILNDTAAAIQKREFGTARTLIFIACRIAEKDKTVSPFRYAKIQEARDALQSCF